MTTEFLVSERTSLLRRAALGALAAASCALLLAACENQKRSITVSGAEAQRIVPVRGVSLQPGWKKQSASALKNPYEGNAYAISQGQQLFTQYNCAGCHFHGGGGIGPPLMDSEWIYGSSPANIYQTISEGRPNGMPSFGGHIPDYQIWYLVAYVRALGGFESKVVTPPRGEEMSSKRAEEP